MNKIGVPVVNLQVLIQMIWNYKSQVESLNQRRMDMGSCPNPCPKRTQTRFFLTSDTGNDMTSGSKTDSDMRLSENLGHGFGLGQLSDRNLTCFDQL